MILPFHKLPTPAGKLEEEGSTSFTGVNVNVLASAPCIVSIFVGRGFGATGESNLTEHQIAMLFIGGPDDRKALSYDWRMSMDHGFCLTVVRFIPGEGIGVEAAQAPVGDSLGLLAALTYIDKQRRLDDEIVNEFRLKSAGEQFMGIDGLVPESRAGPMGDLQVTSSFAQGSVMVVQQYSGYEDEDEDGDDTVDAPDSSRHGREQFRDWRPPSSIMIMVVLMRWSHLQCTKDHHQLHCSD
ncbi:hypothetical protein GH714_028444 [Hevea brasiliensis]|uniref:Uncharacterized protein n=1 Tax=Hevea brasiliensis TaxID=3981 RepID=A0A6A6MLP4_HEVBR|nr:hypothetical protein GH714_028444 [Hevea brasiliensis]